MGNHSVMLVGTSDLPTSYLQTLEQFGCSLCLAATIPAASQTLSLDRSFDLIVIDAGTQGRASLDFLVQLQLRGLRIPVVALCTQGQEDLKADLWKHGVAEILARPYSIEPFTALLTRILPQSPAKPSRADQDETVYLPRAKVPPYDSARSAPASFNRADPNMTPLPAPPPPALLQHHPDYVVFRVGQSLFEVERQMILRTVEMTHGNRTKAAQILGISVRTLYTKLLEIEQEQKKSTTSVDSSKLANQSV